MTDMSGPEMVALCKQHSLFSWSATNKVAPMPVTRAEGIYLYGPEGQKWMDFNSQLMCVNIGHKHPKVVAAMKKALDDEPIFVHPGAVTAVRARLSKKLAELCPGDLNTFFYTLGGAEANENAIKAARGFTGRQKILARYRSYHGGTYATMTLTGDPRRLPNEPGIPGVVHVMDPTPYDFSFGSTDEEIVSNYMTYLEEVLNYEGPHTIAAMIIETVTGTNGVLAPPKGLLKAMKDLLSKHGILLICDEVMAGWGRTGKLFAFQHYDIVPDILTMAKGLTSAYVPLGCVALADRIANHFRENVFYGGLTYNAHPFALATAEAAINVLLEEKMVENAANLEKVMRSEMDRLQKKHPSVKEGRCIGLFGMMDLQKDRKGTPMAPYNGASEDMKKLGAFFNDNGLFTFVRWGSFTCNPPLCITEAQLREAFAIIDKGLDITDKAVKG